MTPAVDERQERLQQAASLELARRRFLPFVKLTWPGYEVYPVHRLIVRELEEFVVAVEHKEKPRLILEMPPRVGKSELVSRRLPPWALGRHPDWNVILVSYGAELAEELSSDARRIVMDDAYRDIFGSTYEMEPGSSVELDRASKAVNHWRLKGKRGGLRAVGTGGSLTGRGAEIVVIDDPVKGRKEADSANYKDDLYAWYKGTLYTRVEPGGGIIVMATRWAVDDLIGRLLDDASNGHGADQWRVMRVPAVAEQDDPLGRLPGEILEGRFTADQLRSIEINIGPREWAAQYQQRPHPAEGAIFHPDEQFVFAEPPRDYVGPRFMFGDTSYARTRESDYSALGMWQIEPPAVCSDGVTRRTLGLLDMYRKRAEFPDLKTDSRRMYVRYGASVFVIEDYGSGKSLIQEFMREARMNIRAWRPDRDKVARAHAAADVMATYRIRLPKAPIFPSGLPVQTYLKELREFGSGQAHDDMVDVTTMACILMGTFDVERRRQRRNQEYEFEIAG